MPPAIHLAFRFHGNFYHSYRGDTPDELGFGKDIRIIRHIIATLDDLNGRGIPVAGTWDFENYFSLETIMPAHCPDIIAAIQRRVRDGRDEMQIMSYNNGLVSAHTAREFEASIARSLTNAGGSGVRDLFGPGTGRMVRPQEMMFTPIHLKLYRALGVDAISLFYSALPFNAFSTFVPPLTLAERYNPLTLTYPGIAETMTLMPCYNTGDLADHLTLKRWVKAMRRAQLRLREPIDLLLLIDMDADDEFWVGFDVPVLSGRFATIGGLQGLVESVADLDYVTFTTPCRYLDDHAPLKAITIGQDTADGSFDGLASWAEKWSNQRLWTGLERSRILALQTARLLEDAPPAKVAELLRASFEARLKALSTTHFGMAAPVMNLTREAAACDLVRRAVDTAAQAFRAATAEPPTSGFSLLDYVRGESTDLIHCTTRPSRALVRLPLKDAAPRGLSIRDTSGRAIPCAIVKSGPRRELLFVAGLDPAGRKDYAIACDRTPAPPAPVSVSASALENEWLRLEFDRQGHLSGVLQQGRACSSGRFLTSAVTYAGQRHDIAAWEIRETLSLGVVGLVRMRGVIPITDAHTLTLEREILLASGLPYLYCRLRVTYPRTSDRKYDRGTARRLQQAWDGAWQEVMPCEISPGLAGRPSSPLHVWKHNYCGHVSRYDLDYGAFSPNTELDSANNHITHAWLALSDGHSGLLVAQSADANSCLAFCPLRTRRQDDITHVHLNPFGSYSGRQYRYATADTGLGKVLAVNFSASDHIKPYAPSYNGRIQEFDLLIAPYAGDEPPQTIQNDALAFAYPYLLLKDDALFADPPHCGWDDAGLGTKP